MKIVLTALFLLIALFTNGQMRFEVSSASDFSLAQEQATSGDTIVWQAGIYYNTRMDIEKDGLVITAIPHGTALFTGASRVVINANNINFSGFQYIGGSIGSLNVIDIYGSDIVISQVNIQNYTSHKYLVVDEICRRVSIRHCNFENRLNLDDKNILSILVDNEPGYHKIQYCSFKNFEGIGKDEGIEPIRIGVSSQGELDSRTLVEYCYFTQCNGDGEIISHKSRQNVYRYNTFENNPVSELVLRHGDEGIVYGNFFLNNKGGIRIREGSQHFIFNNYFEGINERSIWLMNDPVDPLADIHIYHNTFVHSENIRLGGVGSSPPTNVIFANNVFAYPKSEIFAQETENETWINNISFGTLGMDIPTDGLTDADPLLVENTAGYLQPEINSRLINASSDSYPPVPLYPGMDYDNDITLDLMQELRPVSISDRAIGASEYSSSVRVQPFATEQNTGPTYLFDNLVNYVTSNLSQLYIVKEGDSRTARISSNIDWTILNDLDWVSIDINAGSGDAAFIIMIEPNQDSNSRSGDIIIEGANQSVVISIFQDAGEIVNVLDKEIDKIMLLPNPTTELIYLSNLPNTVCNVDVEIIQLDGKIISSKLYSVNNESIKISTAFLDNGHYIMRIKTLQQNGDIQDELMRKFLKN